MALLDRMEWYDLARTTNWTPRYVTEAELFPPEQSEPFGLGLEKWESYDEPYKVIYRDYVAIQREKDTAAYSVEAAASRTRYLDQADNRWLSILKFHYGATALAESCAQWSEARMVRFGKAPGMRNMATFGTLDEIRHAQLQLHFPHELLGKGVQFDWGHKMYHTNQWASVVARHLFDDMFLSHDAATTAIQLTFAFETGFTNMQFLALAADAAEAGDASFSNLISSIQTDESRHAQIGAPVLKILIANGLKKEAQRIVDIAFWRTWKLFAVLTGPIVDYFTPLEKRQSSFKEFMHEWILSQFERTMLDLGLDLPWYWDEFLRDLDFFPHGMHLGMWTYRRTMWFDPCAGVSPPERQWLEEKYPGWSQSWGRLWDDIAADILAGRPERTLAGTLPITCAMCNLPIVFPPGAEYRSPPANVHMLELDDRRYYFCSSVEKWIFELEPERYKDHRTMADRLLAGQMEPSFEGALRYMGLEPDERGTDAYHHHWAALFARPLAAE